MSLQALGSGELLFFKKTPLTLPTSPMPGPVSATSIEIPKRPWSGLYIT